MIDKSYLFSILKDAQKVLIAEENINKINIEKEREITVCGDIHGQYYDLLNIFDINGFPTPERPYLFNGDFVDRGSFGVECVIALLLFKLYNPKSMFLNRGNHEDEGLNKMYGFEGEVLAKYCSNTFKLFLYLFKSLPLAQVINDKIFVVHGGIPKGENFKLEDMKKVNRMAKIPDSGDFCDMLWADPTKDSGIQNSKRGISYMYGPDIAERFLANNGLSLIVRSHEMKEEGYEVEPCNKIITIFSAPKYCDQMTNKGAYIIFKADEMKPLFKTFEAVPHPPKMAMHYAKQTSNMLR